MFKQSEKIPFAGNQPGQHLSGLTTVMPDGIDSISFQMEISQEDEAGPQTYIWIHTWNGEDRTPIAMLSEFSDLDEICSAIIQSLNNAPRGGKLDNGATGIELTDAIAYHSNSRCDADENAEEGGVTCAKATVEHLAGNIILKFVEPGKFSVTAKRMVEDEISGIFVPADKVVMDQIITEFSSLRIARRDEINRLEIEKNERRRAAVPSL